MVWIGQVSSFKENKASVRDTDRVHRVGWVGVQGFGSKQRGLLYKKKVNKGGLDETSTYAHCVRKGRCMSGSMSRVSI